MLSKSQLAHGAIKFGLELFRAHAFALERQTCRHKVLPQVIQLHHCDVRVHTGTVLDLFLNSQGLLQFEQCGLHVLDALSQTYHLLAPLRDQTLLVFRLFESLVNKLLLLSQFP